MLNNQQNKAVLHFSSPLLIVAGAGTGKTRTVVHKILHAIEGGLATPSRILATTFTNKAAHELRHRLQQSLGSEAHSMRIGTFHSISLELLQNYGQNIGLPKNISVIPYEDQIQLIRNILVKRNLKDLKPSSILEKIQKYKENSDNTDFIYHDIFANYQSELKSSKLFDFADLLLESVRLFEENKIHAFFPDFQMVFIDEYQDINDLQNKWLKLLIKEAHLCCVGDPDQAIYGFRGANASHILSFQEQFQPCQIIKLEQNYRSTNPILEAANKLIANNKHRIPKSIYTDDKSEATPINCEMYYSANVEAQRITEKVKEIKALKDSCSIAILVRSRAQITFLEEACLNSGISYTVSGAIEFLDRSEIKDMISYLRFINNSNDTLAFRRMIQAPKRGLGLTTIEKILEEAKNADVDLIQACKLSMKNLSKLTQEKLQIFLSFIEELIQVQHQGLMILANFIYAKSGYLESIPEEKRDNVNKWIRSLAEFDNLREYIEKVLWQTEIENTDTDVQIMTIHMAKGLEFDYVFLPGWEEGILPHQLSRSLYEIEEERRLAYVALTRARKVVHISYASSRVVNGTIRHCSPSRFIREISVGKSFKPIPKKEVEESKIGSRVTHPRFGKGLLEDVGPHFSRVRFSDMIRMVDSKMLSYD